MRECELAVDYYYRSPASVIMADIKSLLSTPASIESSLDHLETDQQLLEQLLCRNHSQHHTTPLFDRLKSLSRMFKLLTTEKLKLVCSQCKESLKLSRQSKISQADIQEYFAILRVLDLTVHHMMECIVRCSRASICAKLLLCKKIFTPLYSVLFSITARLLRCLVQICLFVHSHMETLRSQLQHLELMYPKYASTFKRCQQQQQQQQQQFGYSHGNDILRQLMLHLTDKNEDVELFEENSTPLTAGMDGVVDTVDKEKQLPVLVNLAARVDSNDDVIEVEDEDEGGGNLTQQLQTTLSANFHDSSRSSNSCSGRPLDALFAAGGITSSSTNTRKLTTMTKFTTTTGATTNATTGASASIGLRAVEERQQHGGLDANSSRNSSSSGVASFAQLDPVVAAAVEVGNFSRKRCASAPVPTQLVGSVNKGEKEEGREVHVSVSVPGGVAVDVTQTQQQQDPLVGHQTTTASREDDWNRPKTKIKVGTASATVVKPSSMGKSGKKKEKGKEGGVMKKKKRKLSKQSAVGSESSAIVVTGVGNKCEGDGGDGGGGIKSSTSRDAIDDIFGDIL